MSVILHSGQLMLQRWRRRPSRGRCGVWLVLLGFSVKLVGFIARCLPEHWEEWSRQYFWTNLIFLSILPLPCPPRFGCWRQLLGSRGSLSLSCWLSSHAWPRGSRQASGSGRWWDCTTPTASAGQQCSRGVAVSPCRARAPPMATMRLPSLPALLPIKAACQLFNPAVQLGKSTSMLTGWHGVKCTRALSGRLLLRAFPKFAAVQAPLIYFVTTWQGA